MRQLHIGIVRSHGRHPIAPQLRHFQHVRLIHRAKLAAPPLGGFKGHASDSINLAFGVNHRVDTALFAVFALKDAARLPKVNATGQLAHHHDVRTFDDFPLEGRGIHQLGQNRCRPQIGKQTQTGPQPQQAALGPLGIGQAVPLVAADRRQQHRVTVAANFQGAGGQGFAGLVDRAAPDRRFGELKGHPNLLGDGFEHLNSNAGNFGANAITGQQRNAIGLGHGSVKCREG